MPTPLTDPAAIVRGLRAQSNAALAARDVEGVTRDFASDIHSISGGGALAEGRDAAVATYTAQLAIGGPFVSGARTPDRVTAGRSQGHVSEVGRWKWVVKTPEGQAAFSGDYLAGWVKRFASWRLQSELYVTTGCIGPGCPK